MASRTDLGRCVANVFVAPAYIGRCEHPARTTRPVRRHGGPDFVVLPVCGVHARMADAGARSPSESAEAAEGRR